MRAIIGEQPDMELVAAASTVPELLTQTTNVDVVVLDLLLEDGSSPETNVELLREAGIPALVFTSGDPYLVRMAAKAGVLGVLRKNVHESVLVNALRDAASGTMVPTVEWASAIDADEGFVELPPRLQRVLELYAAGVSGAGVARALGLSAETIPGYVSDIRDIYSAAGRPAPTKTHLYERAIEDGWLPIPRR
ncbi:DNA-binding NarL/FixJ family response regulator [Prescottella agglutinans]|uniref:DNA-binding NarL/FixJ family response regulator n=1 Tax=Prescottella agglutinans TaxID=1644129 RepID=A0ABT6MKQ6_9NOCA|nr:DNA-binding NarL/FixJ family response regulator [Prescottella agglutinans]